MRSFRLSDSFKFAPNVVCQVVGNYNCYGMIAVHSHFNNARTRGYVVYFWQAVKKKTNKQNSNINGFSAELESLKSRGNNQKMGHGREPTNRMSKWVDRYSQSWFFKQGRLSYTDCNYVACELENGVAGPPTKPQCQPPVKQHFTLQEVAP